MNLKPLLARSTEALIANDTDKSVSLFKRYLEMRALNLVKNTQSITEFDNSVVEDEFTKRPFTFMVNGHKVTVYCSGVQEATTTFDKGDRETPDTEMLSGFGRVIRISNIDAIVVDGNVVVDDYPIIQDDSPEDIKDAAALHGSELFGEYAVENNGDFSEEFYQKLIYKFAEALMRQTGKQA